MRKSHLKQMFLSTIFGPAGLCYVSIKAALLLTLTTLIAIVALENHILKILLFSLPISVIVGALLVRTHNKKLAAREYSLSTYIGRVSCQIVGQTTVKRDYHTPLAKARWKNKAKAHTNKVLALMCVVVSGFIAMPSFIKQFSRPALVNKEAATNFQSPLIKVSAKKFELLNNGRWKIESSDKTSYVASLKANEYQDSSDGWYRPTLILSCHKKKTELLFTTSEILGTANTTITLSFDDSAGIRKPWKTRNDYRSAIAPTPIMFAKELTHSNYLSVTYQTFGTNQHKSATFQLSDSNDTVKSIRQKCSW